MFVLGLFAAVFWAVGTNLLNERWYVVRGVSIGDVVFLFWCGFAFFSPEWSALMERALARVRTQVGLLIGLMVILLISTGVNALRFGAQWTDVLAIARLLYFVVIVVFTVAFVRRFGGLPILGAFLAGIALLALGRYYEAVTRESAVLIAAGVPILNDPNVIGNMLGVGAFLASLGLLKGKIGVPLVLATLFTWLSVYTFSKGTWLMIVFSTAANAVAFQVLYQRSRPRARRVVRWCLAAVLAGTAVLAVTQLDKLKSIVQFKLESTADIHSVEERWRLAAVGIFAMLDHPFVGIGFRNFQMTYDMYPGYLPEPAENAHNVFAQLGAVGGVPALLLFTILFVLPFRDLRQLLPFRGPRRWIYLAAAFCVFFISGGVQLQMMAQPYFWFFSGLVAGWRWRQEAALLPTAVPAEVPGPRAVRAAT